MDSFYHWDVHICKKLCKKKKKLAKIIYKTITGTFIIHLHKFNAIIS